MNPSDSNDPLDAFLREQNEYIEDDGFTARVIAALPRRRRRVWLRPVILLGAVAIGSVLAVLWLPWRNLPVPDSSGSISLDFQSLMSWLLVLSIPASLVWVAVSAFTREHSRT